MKDKIMNDFYEIYKEYDEFNRKEFNIRMKELEDKHKNDKDVIFLNYNDKFYILLGEFYYFNLYKVIKINRGEFLIVDNYNEKLILLFKYNKTYKIYSNKNNDIYDNLIYDDKIDDNNIIIRYIINIIKNRDEEKMKEFYDMLIDEV